MGVVAPGGKKKDGKKIINNPVRVANLQFEVWLVGQEICATFLIMCRTFFFLHTVLSSNLLPKNIKIKIYKIIVFHVVLYGCETCCFTLRKARKLRVFENRVLKKVFGPKTDEVMGEWRRLHNEQLCDLYSPPNIIKAMKIKS